MTGLWKGINRFRWTPLLAALAVFCIACLIWQWRAQADRRNRTLTQLDLAMITDSLKSWSADSAVAISRDSLTNLNASNLYALLSATNAGAFLLEHQKDWDQRHELVDAWSRPFHMQLLYPDSHLAGTNVTLPPATVSVKIWSEGPNGRDEQGSGDDITSEVVSIKLHP